VDLLGGRSADIPRWIRLLDNGTTEMVELDLQQPEVSARLHEVEDSFPHDVLRLVGHTEAEVTLAVSDEDLPDLERLTVLVTGGTALERLRDVEHLEEVEEAETSS
jgi:hypothetical protein